jgi:hypothetical protein
MKWDGCLEPFLWELRQYNPKSKGFPIYDAAANGRKRFCRLFLAMWCHDTRGLPLYTHSWQTPCKLHFCLWCSQSGFTMKGAGATCYMGAVRALSAHHGLKRAHAEAFSDDDTTPRARLAILAPPKPATPIGSARRMAKAAQMVKAGRDDDDTRVRLFAQIDSHSL